MPNLLKSLPREILEKEDSKFIYNVLNPLLFDKIKETNEDTTVTHKVSSLLNKDINFSGQFLPEFILPHNINSREFHVYMSDGQENVKIEHFGKTELITELDDIKDYIFFYFGVEGYYFLYDIIKKYFYVKNEYEKNKNQYEYNYKKYLEVVDVRKKKVYKSTYEHFKKLYEKFEELKIEFDIVFEQSTQHASYSTTQLVDNYAREIGFHLGIKTFDNDIVFAQSKLFEYLNTAITYDNVVTKHIFSGKNILSSHEFELNSVFELIAIFSLEFTNIKEKYEQYLKLLVDNGDGYALNRSSHKMLKNEKHSNISLDLQSDNLTYFINEENNELEIYVYFLKEFRIDESTFGLIVNDREIPASIHSLTGNINHGYTLFEYFDDTTKYYKITVHDYLVYDLDGDYINYDIENINVVFDVVKSNYNVPNSSQELYVESVGFLDNFVIYKKNETTGFFEVMNVPYKVKISIEEKEERYVRSYEFLGIHNDAQNELISQSEIIIGCYDYDYFYEPKIYVDFFKYSNSEINFRYNTILPYVLIDDVMGEDFEISYYSDIPLNEYSTNISKNIVMYDGKTYKKLFDEINQMRIINPYNEPNYEFISKISYASYKDRNHTNSVLITNMVNKIPFKENLKFLDRMQYDSNRNMLFFMIEGIQKVLPLNEGLERGLNYENITFNRNTKRIEYHGVEMCDEGFVFANNAVYLRNPLTNEFDELETIATEQINLSVKENIIFFDMFEMFHCIILDGIKYKIDGIYVDTYTNALNNPSVMFVESNYGIPRYKTISGEIIDVEFSNKVLDGETHLPGKIAFDRENGVLIYKYNETELYTMTLSTLETKISRHRQVGMCAFSIFYAGNVLPENSNKTFFGRENIYSSMFIPDDIYNIGRNGDVYNDLQNHELLAEQLDLNVDSAAKYNIEQEPYLMFKSSTASLKGLESYIKSSLKSISDEIGISPVYLVQRNRFISEWAKVSGVNQTEFYAEAPLKELVADLMETKLLNNNYDDLMDIFKNNDYEKFSINTNNIHSILIQYILRFLNDDAMLEEFTYYLIHEIWIKNNRKKIIDFIKENADDKTISLISEMQFNNNYEKEQLFYTFVNELGKIEKQTIESYIPIANYSDWKLYEENNHVHFDKPYRYEIIDISSFISMPVDWDEPLCMIRPLNEDHVFVKRDYRFLDISIVTHSQITYQDSYNEYVEDIKNKLNRNVDYVEETLDVLNEVSMTDGFDMMGVNLVVIKWMAERFLPTYLSSNTLESVEELREVIRTELMSADHPNMIVSYNRIKESTLLGDLGTNKDEIYESITAGDLVLNKTIRLNITSSEELEYLDKVKRPLEHYFDYLFFVKRHDIIAKVLALFTEDVIATSMLDLSFAINIKNTKGDETFDIYEKMIYDIFDEFLPFHTVLDKIIFTIKILEGLGAEAVSKEVTADVKDTYLVDIVLDFAEKVRIQTADTAMISRTHIYIPTEGMVLCGAHDEIPYDYDRKVKVAGHDIPPHMDDLDGEFFGVDDEWYVINRDRWRHRVEDLPTPPQYGEFWWNCGVPQEFEKVAETYLQDYYKIKTELFERDGIESHFVDTIPVIDISQGVSDDPDIDVTEDYLIHIDSVYKINFYDMELLGHDEYGQDDAWGPDDQTTLVDLREGFRENVLHDFYDKINVVLLDSIWTDVFVIYDLDTIPGHDEFGIDEYYHQRSPERLDQELTIMAYDELLMTGFEVKTVDMSDISLVDESLAMIVAHDFREMILDTVVADQYHITVDIMVNRNFDSDGRFLKPGHDEFVYDEYYHNSTDELRADNIGEVLIGEYMGDIRIDFGFMRMLPFDPYQDLIDQQFYRANQPGSDLQTTRIKDVIYSDIHTFTKDLIRVGTMDLYELDLIDEDLRRTIYEGIEKETIGGDSFASTISDSLINRNIHHDFRESIIAIDKYASILNDEDILTINTNVAAQAERDNLFTLELGDTVYSTIHVKHDVERSMTKFDRDYLKSIKIEEENFVEFKYMDDQIEIRFDDLLKTYLVFNERATLTLTSLDKTFIEQYDKENTSISILDNVHYGHNYDFDIDGMTITGSDLLVQAWSNKIHKDSMVISITDQMDLTTDVDFDFDFGVERTTQPHNEYGQMGYTDESIDRAIESKLTDSLIFTMTDGYDDNASIELYDGIMTDIQSYDGDYIAVVISESLHTYIDIVKKPWIFPEFDNFEHNQYPHMYNGDSDEFDVTTQLRDSVKADAYTSVYDNDALIELHDRIHVGYGHPVESDMVSVSMTDDLKVVEYGIFGVDYVTVDGSDSYKTQTSVNDDGINIVVSDRIWYGYKLRDDMVGVQTNDHIIAYDYVSETDGDIDRLPIAVRDWLLIEYTFIDDKPNIQTTDRITYSGIGTSPKDIASIALRDTLDVHELLDIENFDTARVYINDKLIVDSETDEPTYEEEIDVDVFVKDNIGVGINDVLLGYGPGKKLKEKLIVWADNRLHIENYPSIEDIPTIDVDLDENFDVNVILPAFKDSLNISTYERMKFGPLFIDRANVLTSEMYGVGREWLNDRYGVDDFPHSDRDLEYYNDAVDRTITTQLYDDIKFVTELHFGDVLGISAIDRLSSGDGDLSTVNSLSTSDSMVVSGVDNVMYGIDHYEYVWDAKEWEKFGYDVPYEGWTGLIPHDEPPHDELGHSQHGDDLSQISTGVTDNLILGFDYLFKDTLTVQTSDVDGFETWGYQSVFKDSARVYMNNRIKTDWTPVDDNTDVMINLKKESLSINYNFDDKIKTVDQVYIEDDGGFSSEEINIYDADTLQLIENIFRYRIYEKIDAAINDNLLTSTLFKYDDELSLITDYKTKIDLYKAEDNGSVTRSMTVIKDKVTENIELLFSDGIMAVMKDKLHGTEAIKPNEYLE